MLGREDNSKNFKDTPDDLSLVVKDIPISISYTKTNKLITALYMVTDIIDQGEPLRNKLRTLGTGIISDMHQEPLRASGKISEIMSFLGIAKSLNIISEMNCNILEKEFSKLGASIRESSEKRLESRDELDLSEFFREEFFTTPQISSKDSIRRISPLKDGAQMRIGVQRGSTFMKALSDQTRGLSDTNQGHRHADQFDVLKRERRSDIISFIKHNGGSATITDIRTRATGSLAKCGEKTLQRELLSMLKDGVLKKTGEKRWSRYFLSD